MAKTESTPREAWCDNGHFESEQLKAPMAPQTVDFALSITAKVQQLGLCPGSSSRLVWHLDQQSRAVKAVKGTSITHSNHARHAL
jgi:hypothetical protein